MNGRLNLTQTLRSKMRVIKHQNRAIKLADFSESGFDGSSTYQATGNDSDLTLKPVHFITDPSLAECNYFTLFEIFSLDGSPHPSNTHAWFPVVANHGVGFEQEYTLFFQKAHHSGWPE